MDKFTQIFGYLLFALHILTLCTSDAYALTYPLPAVPNNIVGQAKMIRIDAGDSLFYIARKNDLGLPELLAANPGMNGKKRGKLFLPKLFILPSIREGVVINLPEMRLYYFHPNKKIVMTYPIGIGREGWETPVTYTYIMHKEASPFWYVPKSIRENALQTKGIELPEVMEPGPQNPLGDYAFKLALSGYLIHGTNRPSSIGTRSSSGCIRMYPEDIEELFITITHVTPVYIIHEPYKLGYFNHEIYLEAHSPLNGYSAPAIEALLQQILGTTSPYLSADQIKEIIKNGDGYPILIGTER